MRKIVKIIITFKNIDLFILVQKKEEKKYRKICSTDLTNTLSLCQSTVGVKAFLNITVTRSTEGSAIPSGRT